VSRSYSSTAECTRLFGQYHFGIYWPLDHLINTLLAR